MFQNYRVRFFNDNEMGKSLTLPYRIVVEIPADSSVEMFKEFKFIRHLGSEPKFRELISWMNSNIGKHSWTHRWDPPYSRSFLFKKEDDALLFRLTWC